MTITEQCVVALTWVLQDTLGETLDVLDDPVEFLVGGFVAAFVFAQFISVGGFFFQLEWGYVLAFLFFIVVMFWKPEGLLSKRK